MNKDHILFHLKEAEEAIRKTISSIETDSAYDVAELRLEVAHIYHHLNTSWNGRDEPNDEASEENFDKWRIFPKDLEDYL
jgi:hypothetical protein